MPLGPPTAPRFETNLTTRNGPGCSRVIVGRLPRARRGDRLVRRLPSTTLLDRDQTLSWSYIGPPASTQTLEPAASAIEQASAAAGDKLVHIMGGAGIIQQALAAGLVDELFLHVAPVILGDGTRLFEKLGGPEQLERTEVIESLHTTHLRYQIPKGSA